VSPQIAVNTAVTRDELLDFIRPRHHAIVITARADVRPQASPVTCGVDAGGRMKVQVSELAMADWRHDRTGSEN
jgi:hypothetical protein